MDGTKFLNIHSKYSVYISNLTKAKVTTMQSSNELKQQLLDGINAKIKEGVQLTLQQLVSQELETLSMPTRIQQSAPLAWFLLEKFVIDAYESKDRHIRELAFKCASTILDRAGYGEIKRVAHLSSTSSLTKDDIAEIKQRAITALQTDNPKLDSTLFNNLEYDIALDEHGDPLLVQRDTKEELRSTIKDSRWEVCKEGNNDEVDGMLPLPY